MPGFPSQSQYHVNVPLTNMSVAYIQEDTDYIADKVFPIVPVERQGDIYFEYNKGDFFRNEAQLRAEGTESAGGGYRLTHKPYFASVYAFHRNLTERERTNSNSPLDPERDTAIWLTKKLLLKREVEWTNNFFKPGIWANQLTGGVASSAGGDVLIYWNDFAHSIPAQDISRAKRKIKRSTGLDPNTLVLGRNTFDQLCEHPLVLNRMSYTQEKIATEGLLASLFKVQRVLVANAVVNNADMAKDPDFAKMDFAVGENSALLCYTATSPGIYQASAGYIFGWRGLLGSGAYGNRINKIQMDWLELGTQRIEAEMAFDMKVVGKDLAVYFDNIVEGEAV